MVPETVLQCITTLQQAGYPSYLVGGCVRDLLLGKEPQDFDIATAASPETVGRLFRRVVPTGLPFGTVTEMCIRDRLRPGRFDRQVILDQPDVRGREAILKVHAVNKPLEKNVDLAVLARRTPGFTGADLANMLNEAAILAARRNKRRIGMDELEEAIDRVIAGPERRSRVISEREKRLVAYHEAGHAVLGLSLIHIYNVLHNEYMLVL